MSSRQGQRPLGVEARAPRGGQVVPVMIGDVLLRPAGSGELVAYALGSCIGVAVWARDIGVGALAHVQLPSAKNSSHETLAESPGRFADLAIPLLLRRLGERGASRGALKVVLAGGARVGQGEDPFSIGARNITAVRRLLWAAQIICAGEDVGGTHPRTVRVDLSDGGIAITGGSAALTF